MGKHWVVLAVLVGCATVVGGWDCGSSSAGPDGGNACFSTGPSEGVPCNISLTGAVDLDFQCRSAFARYDGTTNTTSLVQIGASHVPNPTNPDAGVSSINITLAFTGPPQMGPANLVPASPTSKPNSILLFLSDPLMTTFATAYPDGGPMSLTITGFDQSFGADGGQAMDLWCLHGNLSAPVPNFYNHNSVVMLDASF